MPPKFNTFIDIHTHFLPGIDDGAETIQESLAMARLYAQHGIRHVIATPHFLPGSAWTASKQTILDLTITVQEHLQQEGINLTLYPGMEIAYHRKIATRLKSDELLPLGLSAYYLLEPAFSNDQSGLYSDVRTLTAEGYSFILAHPERIEAFQNHFNLLEGLINFGVRFQINTGSLLGHFGKTCLHTARTIAENRWIHYLGSDAHNATSRTPLTPQEWETLVHLDQKYNFLDNCLENSTQLLKPYGQQ